LYEEQIIIQVQEIARLEVIEQHPLLTNSKESFQITTRDMALLHLFTAHLATPLTANDEIHFVAVNTLLVFRVQILDSDNVDGLVFHDQAPFALQESVLEALYKDVYLTLTTAHFSLEAQRFVSSRFTYAGTGYRVSFIAFSALLSFLDVGGQDVVMHLTIKLTMIATSRRQAYFGVGFATLLEPGDNDEVIVLLVKRLEKRDVSIAVICVEDHQRCLQAQVLIIEQRINLRQTTRRRSLVDTPPAGVEG
jgi:hypothetical protein